MKVRRRHPLSEPVALAAQRLKQCESRIALLDRVRPLELAAERARLTAALGVGAALTPVFHYAPSPDLSETFRCLRELQPGAELEGQLLGARARELELEAALVQAVGTSQFRALAAARFPLPESASELHAAALAALAPQLPSREDLHFSDDRSDPHSLWSRLTARLEAARLPVRVESAAGLVPLAAVADGLVRIRAGARLSAAVSERIALHEVDGHVRPRHAAKQLGGVWLAGGARASEDEEGRAIWLELQAQLLSPARRAELALRYLAAESVRHGADFQETVQLLLAHGSLAESAIDLACRVHRGGGLGRELLYLSGFRRVETAFAARPELDAVLSHGRVSLEAAAQLLDSGSVELDDDRDVV